MATDYLPTQPTSEAVILTFNGGEAAVRCVESARASSLCGLRVHVVDNASADDTVARLLAAFPDLEVTVNQENLGFGAGCNVGLEAAVARGADYVLLLNQDTLIAKDAAEQMVSFMEGHPAAGICAAKTLAIEPMPDGSPKLLYAGAFRGALPLRQRVPGIERADLAMQTSPILVDYAWGHGMLLRVAAIRTVGIFDPAFFMYWEDLDLCCRMRQAGQEIWCLPDAVIWHDVQDGARAIDSEYWRWFMKARSMAIFHRKHSGKLKGPILSALTVGAEAVQLLRQGKIRALRHQLAANLQCALGFGRGPARSCES